MFQLWNLFRHVPVFKRWLYTFPVSGYCSEKFTFTQVWSLQTNKQAGAPIVSSSCSKRKSPTQKEAEMSYKRRRLMRKTADGRKGGSWLYPVEEEEAQPGEPLSTYKVKVPAPLEGESLFKTHCSLVCYTSSMQTKYVCVCANAYLNTLHPNLHKPCLYKLEKGKKEGGSRRHRFDKVIGQREKKEKRGEKQTGRGGTKEERKIPLLGGCCHGNEADNTYWLCHRGKKESEELTPPPPPHKKTHT